MLSGKTRTEGVGRLRNGTHLHHRDVQHRRNDGGNDAAWTHRKPQPACDTPHSS